METINWNNYNYDEFTMFCNALLTFEFGKSYQPFSASGRDGGIDGFYDGEYNQSKGKWRFQFKFHQVARRQAVISLKSQIKEEAKLLKDEDHFVLLTNVELLPQENQSLIDAFNEELMKLSKFCSCLVWDGAKLFNLYLRHPLLSIWLDDGFSTAQLQRYGTAFRKNLNAEIFEPGTFSNFFIERKDCMGTLTEFLDSTDVIMVISGGAGLGKTRLVVEFFKYVDQLEDWLPLVLSGFHVDCNRIKKALSSSKKYVILIDDAQEYDPKVISDIKMVAESLDNTVKLVLTTRTLDVYKSLSLIKEYETAKFPKITLENLSKQDTETIFRHYITDAYYSNYISELVSLSYGKPIMIIAILNAISKGVAISKIKEDDFLKDHVSNYFNKFIIEVSNLTQISQLSIQRLLRNVALIEPFNFSDNKTVEKLAEAHGLKPNDVQYALKFLQDNGFISGRYEQSIKPDYYSDILLSEISNDEVGKWITQYPSHIDKVIVNLSSVDEVRSDSKNLLNEILISYANRIIDENDESIIHRILTTARDIGAVQQSFAKRTVINYISAISKNESVVWRSYHADRQASYFSEINLFGIITAILKNLYSYGKEVEFSFNRAMELYSNTKDERLAKIFSLSKRDIIEQLSLKRQFFLLDYTTIKISNYSDVQLSFVTHCLDVLLELEFTVSEWNTVNEHTMSIKTYYLPNSKSVKKMRGDTIKLLKKIYVLPAAKSLQHQLLKQVLDIPRKIFASRKTNLEYKGKSEIKSVLLFLKGNVKNFGLSDKRLIHDQLYWYNKWGISADFDTLMNEIKNLIKPRDLTEQLSYLFSKAETSMLERGDPRGHIVSQVPVFVKEANAVELSKNIVQYLEQEQNIPHYYWSFHDELIKTYPEYAKVLNDYMYRHSFKLYVRLGSSLLNAVYFKHNDVTYYWTFVEKLQLLDLPEADNILLDVYGRRVPGKTNLTSRDVNVIIKIFEKKNRESVMELSSALQSLFVVNDPNATTYCLDFLDRAQQREANMFFMWLSDNVTASDEQKATLVLNGTLRFALTYELEKSLNDVLRYKGADAIFKYLLKRYQFGRERVDKKKGFQYEFVPDGEHSYLFEDCDPGVQVDLYLRALDWYINDDWELRNWYSKDLLEYLKPGKTVPDSLINEYLLRFLNFGSNGEKLKRLIESLSIFHTKDDNFFKLIISIYDFIQNFENNIDLYRDLRSECYLAIITMGVKVGTAGVPYQVDIDLQNALQSCINSLPEYSSSKAFLKEVLKSVDKEIEESINRGNSEW